MDVLKQLKKLADTDYKAFNKKIIPTEQTVIGVRIPALRKLAKQIAKDPQAADAFIARDKKNIYEMIMLEGMVLSYLDESFIALRLRLENYLAKVDNWAQIDSTICNCKNITQEKSAVLEITRQWLMSKQEFVVRAALVMLLAHYVEEKHLAMIFKCSQQVNHPGYYVKMANAWLISVCMAKFPQQTLAFFEDNKLDHFTHNKAIQKSRESYRVEKADKDRLNLLKRQTSDNKT